MELFTKVKTYSALWHLIPVCSEVLGISSGTVKRDDERWKLHFDSKSKKRELDVSIENWFWAV